MTTWRIRFQYLDGPVREFLQDRSELPSSLEAMELVVEHLIRTDMRSLGPPFEPGELSTDALDALSVVAVEGC